MGQPNESFFAALLVESMLLIEAILKLLAEKHAQIDLFAVGQV